MYKRAENINYLGSNRSAKAPNPTELIRKHSEIKLTEVQMLLQNLLMLKLKDSEVSLEELGKSTFSCSYYLIFLPNTQLLRLIRFRIDPKLVKRTSPKLKIGTYIKQKSHPFEGKLFIGLTTKPATSYKVVAKQHN